MGEAFSCACKRLINTSLALSFDKHISVIACSTIETDDLGQNKSQQKVYIYKMSPPRAGGNLDDRRSGILGIDFSTAAIFCVKPVNLIILTSTCCKKDFNSSSISLEVNGKILPLLFKAGESMKFGTKMH